MLFRPSVDSKYGTCGAATDLFHLGDPNVGDSFGRQPGLDDTPVDTRVHEFSHAQDRTGI